MPVRPHSIFTLFFLSTIIAWFSPCSAIAAPTLSGCTVFPPDNIWNAPDDRWDNDMLHQLGTVKGSDFEAVDISSLMENPDSGKVKSAPAPVTGKPMPQLHLLLQQD